MKRFRVKREFELWIQPTYSPTPGAPPAKRKYSRVHPSEKQQSHSKANPLIDEVSQYVNKKITHCALTVRDPNQKNTRFFEITANPASSDGDSDCDDRFDSDSEDEADTPVPTSGVTSSCKQRGEVDAPVYEISGGVLWHILERLGSSTKFTDSEIRHEAQRVWARGQGRWSAQRFCVALAVAIRCRQQPLLKVLSGQEGRKG